jgi:hypothetical protein
VSDLAPQCEQNLNLSGFFVPHELQNMAFLRGNLLDIPVAYGYRSKSQVAPKARSALQKT